MYEWYEWSSVNFDMVSIEDDDADALVLIGLALILNNNDTESVKNAHAQVACVFLILCRSPAQVLYRHYTVIRARQSSAGLLKSALQYAIAAYAEISPIRHDSTTQTMLDYLFCLFILNLIVL